MKNRTASTALLMGLLTIALTAPAQNITDLAVMNSTQPHPTVQGLNDPDDWTDGPAIADSIFLHPDRIRYDSRCLQIEGKDVFLLSGTFHYFRTPEPLWHDRMEKIRAAGFNCVETYVPWNWHEREMPASVDDFSKVDLSELDRFLTLAEELSLYVIVRPGPYICAEWSGGGFPQWLMHKRPSVTKHEVWLQSDDPVFMAWNRHWYQAVAQVTEPHQIHHRRPGTGGVILWQIENEFNRVKWIPSKCKRAYLEELARISRQCGIEVPFITCWTDQARNVKEGPLNGVIDMVNSYPRWQIRKGFGRLINQQLKSQPGKPLISGELQGGWSSDLRTSLSWDMDGQTPAQTQNITLYALQRGFCALNYYMLVGGTNFEDWAARNQTASYDFAAAIGEDGTVNERYYRMKALADFVREHGTHIARSRIEPVTYQTTDTLVELTVRCHPDGTRYLFVRTEEHTKPHSGTLTFQIEGKQQSLDFDLEAFGSRVYVDGAWYPTEVEHTGKPQPHQLVQTLTPQLRQSKSPSQIQYTPLHIREGQGGGSILRRYPILYKVKGKVKQGGTLTVERVGKNRMNRTEADVVVAFADKQPLSIAAETDSTVSFTVPKGTKALTFIYDSRGLHHHTNQAVEAHWHIGPRYVTLDNQPVRLAFTEANSSLITFHSSLKAQHSAPLWLRLSHKGDGFVYLNGHCLGRCYERGPQKEYYLPECWLRGDGTDEVCVMLLPTEGAEVTGMALMAVAETPRTCAYDQPVADIKKRIDQYVERHQTAPQWLLSRMAMYWKEGEHYTQCYISNQHWHHGEGNAPVPTLRLPGERTWNKNPRPRLADLQPYNETGDLTVGTVTVPYRNTGHSVRSINGEILGIAADAAYVYSKTGDERYARLAADVFNQALLGVYYMQPVINLTPHDTEGPGGWQEGGILGYYDYEQIHDDIGLRLATIYDYAREYLIAHPTEAMRQTGKDTRRMMNEVMRRFIDLGMIRGGRTGNWNVNGWDMMFRPILVLEDNSYFDDGKGRQYFLHYLTEESTKHHSCIPDMLRQYNPITGLWPESPGYSFGTVLSILSWEQPLKQQGIDIISKYDILQKAMEAIPVWSDYRGNSICFGDYRGGRIGKESPVGKPGWTASSYSPFHRMAVLKNFDDPTFPMMACLYGGRNGAHLSPNGLALILYGYGYALSPDASAYESYWSEDKAYHQSVQGANTILQGYQAGDVTLDAMLPAIDTTRVFAAEAPTGSMVRMATMTAAEKQRTVVLVKGSSGLGYYLDLFDPGMDSTDYVMHTVGRDVTIQTDNSNGGCQALWTVDDTLRVRLWVSGGTKRQYSRRMNPASYTNGSLTPGGVSTRGLPTPTFYAHQDNNTRYANVYEVYREGRPAIQSVVWQYSKGQPTSIGITLTDGTRDSVTLKNGLSITRSEKEKVIKLL